MSIYLFNYFSNNDFFKFLVTKLLLSISSIDQPRKGDRAEGMYAVRALLPVENV